MTAPQRSPTIGDVLSRVGCPLVEVAADEPVESIASLLTFSGLDAVLLVLPCGRAERIVSMRTLIGSLAACRAASVTTSGLPRCRLDDPLLHAARTMFSGGEGAMLVEQDGKRLAIVTTDNLARYLVSVAGARD